MTHYSGVYIAYKKDSTKYYRSSFTYKNKHISLGSYNIEEDAHKAYIAACEITSKTSYSLDDYYLFSILSYDKYISLLNFKDNNIYFKNPIYLYKSFFIYHMSQTLRYKFDVDDLFYYSNHKIMKRGGHLFVSDYGMQVNILSRYGIKNFAVLNRDYYFLNGDSNDFRYSNIKIINKYHGVFKEEKKGCIQYTAKIHINGDTIIGRYSTETEAAVAYNKAVDLILSKGFRIDYVKNYIIELNKIDYSKIYNCVRVSKALKRGCEKTP